MKKRTSKKTTTTEAGVTAIKPLRITSVTQLEEIIRKPIILPFGWSGQACEIELLPLTPSQSEQVDKVMLELALPPYKPVPGANNRPMQRNGETVMDYDYNDRGWQEKRAQLTKEQRSLRIYLGCPAIRAAKPGLTNRTEIHEFIFGGEKGGGLFTENILELISLNLQVGGLEAAERVNFTTASGSGN